MRLIIKFEKVSLMRYVGHLDMMRIFQRAFSRAHLPLIYSEGFNPHPIFSFASALSVGLQSKAEYMEVAVQDQNNPAELMKHLQAALPEGLYLLKAGILPPKYPSLMSVVTASDYEFYFDILQQDTLLAQFMAQAPIMVEKETKYGVKTIDIRPMIECLALKEHFVFARLKTGSAANLNAELLLKSFLSFAKSDLPLCDIVIMRTAIDIMQGDKVVSGDVLLEMPV